MLDRKAYAGCSQNFVGGTIINGCPKGAVHVHLQGLIVGTSIIWVPKLLTVHLDLVWYHSSLLLLINIELGTFFNDSVSPVALEEKKLRKESSTESA